MKHYALIYPKLVAERVAAVVHQTRVFVVPVVQQLAVLGYRLKCLGAMLLDLDSMRMPKPNSPADLLRVDDASAVESVVL